jgi:hypothetical protein
MTRGDTISLGFPPWSLPPEQALRFQGRGLQCGAKLAVLKTSRYKLNKTETRQLVVSQLNARFDFRGVPA